MDYLTDTYLREKFSNTNFIDGSQLELNKCLLLPNLTIGFILRISKDFQDNMLFRSASELCSYWDLIVNRRVLKTTEIDHYLVRLQNATRRD